MSLPRNSAVPRVPTLPQGEVVAGYPTYLEAQRAVDHLSDKQFAVQAVTIVGSDLRMVERVTGRLTYAKVAIAGLASGAWFGLFVGLLLYLFGGSGAEFSVLVAVAIGAGFGLLFSVLSYAMTGRKRDFTSSSQIVATTYALLCLAEKAGEARQMLAAAGLAGVPGGGMGAASTATTTSPAAGVPAGMLPPPANGAQPGAAPSAPASAPPSHFVDESGRPRYGVRLSDLPTQPDAASGAEQPAGEQAPQQPPAPPTA